MRIAYYFNVSVESVFSFKEFPTWSELSPPNFRVSLRRSTAT